MPDLTDNSAKAYSDAYESAIKAVVSRYTALSRLDAVEASSLLRDIDFEQLFRTTYGMDKALEGLAVSFAKEIIVTPPPPALPSSQVLSAALQFNVDAANTQITQTASEIKKIMMNSIIGKQSEAQFAAALNSETLRPDQINSYVNQNLRTFHRTVEAQMAEANPQELYIWDGPLDDRTSPECTEMIAEGALPYDEWQSKYGQYLNAGTHYGCRHTLQMFVQAGQLDDTRKAREELGEV